MNPILKIINSCETLLQLDTCEQWVAYIDKPEYIADIERRKAELKPTEDIYDLSGAD